MADFLSQPSGGCCQLRSCQQWINILWGWGGGGGGVGVVSLAKCHVIYSANARASSELAETGQRSKYVLMVLEEMLGDVL